MESVYRQLIKVGGLIAILFVLALVWSIPSRLDSGPKPLKIQRAVFQDDENNEDDKGGNDDDDGLPEVRLQRETAVSFPIVENELTYASS